jgi:septum formation protein
VEQAVSLAMRKTAQVAMALPDAIVLGADTIVVHGGEVLNKPVDLAEAERMLRRLRGVDHLVHTGLAVIAPGQTSLTAVATSTVRMRPFSDAELAAYLETGESLDKAGAYGIQGATGDIVESVDGCYTNVVGLPLCSAARLLITAGVRIEAPAPACGFRSDRRCPVWPARSE